MAESVNWSFSSAVERGPTVAGSDRLDVDAYDKLSVTLAAAAPDTTVDILPPGAAGATRLLIVKASSYASNLTLTTGGAASVTVPLDGPLVLIGAGAVALLTGDLVGVHFANGLNEEVTVDILVGRDATP